MTSGLRQPMSNETETTKRVFSQEILRTIKSIITSDRTGLFALFVMLALALLVPAALPSPAAARPRASSPRSIVDAVRLRGGLGHAAPGPLEGPLIVSAVPTKPFEGQKPGTSGLRKKTKVFQQEHYLENFVQSLFDSLPPEELLGSTIVVSGDGRYHNAHAIHTICQLAAANGVGRVWIGVGGLLSTPAASAVIREREGGVAFGGIILSASHNPGGPDEDFGIKYNVRNGGPAPESVTNAIHERTTTISEYKSCLNLPRVDLSQPARYEFERREAAPFVVEVVDNTEDYLALLKQAFDFPKIAALLRRGDMSLVFDAMSGVAGPYAHAIFVREFGVDTSALLNCVPSETFDGGHPDPNLEYAATLVARMGLTKHGTPSPDEVDAPVFGAAADGDADRNMILGRGCFVTPSDSLAILVAHAHTIPWFQREGGLKSVARSMPTSGAVDRVAEQLGLPLFETPTGWKFFGNLMDAHLLGKEKLSPLICGEESFGTGSSHVREKDGLWAVLAWLSVLAHHNKKTPEGALIGVHEIVREHWQRYGRNYYTRYDYEQVDAADAARMVAHLLEYAKRFQEEGYGPESPQRLTDMMALSVVDEFSYTDPIDGSVASKQGIRFLFDDGSRIVFRLSGTGSVGATIRIYIEKYQRPDDSDALEMEVAVALEPLVELALAISKVREFTGRDRPTVIT
ncbi:hypothetical protein AB1Y20_019771 [Prymnesium parvum]|uniref:phosphoglucomutase (alpha-D-glucose-1,6-bisphosphate-dependent) n=1 Tax=Prymnesium parvum TaxID=97485 RepID=A0AB34JVD1_PRYPA